MTDAPEGTPTSVVGDIGVAFVIYKVGTRLGWTVRWQPTGDYGIDAQIETHDASGQPSGALIAAQIKHGKTFFGQRSDDPLGWVFYGSLRHLRYWLGHSLPVLVIIVNTETNKAYWQKVSLPNIEFTETQWKMVVPESQVLDETVADRWAGLASRNEERVLGDFAVNCERVPPECAKIIREWAENDELSAAYLVATLADGRDEPGYTVHNLLAAQPSWLGSSGPLPWLALGSYANEHHEAALASRSFELAAEQAPDTKKARYYALAGICLCELDPVGARPLLRMGMDSREGLYLAEAGMAIVERATPDANTTIPQGIAELVAAQDRVLDEEPTLLSFLGSHYVIGNDLERGITYYERASAAGTSSAYIYSTLASLYLRRSTESTGPAPGADLRTARNILLETRAAVRKWDGPTAEITTQLAKVCLATSDFTGALSCTASAPDGEATPREAGDPQVQALCARSAIACNRLEIVDKLLPQITDLLTLARVQADRIESSGTDDERRDRWREVQVRAAESNDVELIVMAAGRLASLGIWPNPTLDDYIQIGRVPSVYREIFAASSLRYSGAFQEALEQVRPYTVASPIATDSLIATLSASGDTDQAVQECEKAFGRFRQIGFKLQKLDLLRGAGRDESAAEWTISILQDVTISNDLRLELTNSLVVYYYDKNEQSEVETYCWAYLATEGTDALPIGSPDIDLLTTKTRGVLWTLAFALHAQTRAQAAYDLVQRYKLVPEIEGQIRLWSELHSGRAWTDDDVLLALALADDRERAGQIELAAGILSMLTTDVLSEHEVHEEGGGA